MSISQINSTISSLNGLAKPSKFYFYILPPKVLQGSAAIGTLLGATAGGSFGIGQDLRLVSTLVDSVTMPGKGIQSKDYQIDGALRKIPTGVTFTEFTAVFKCDNEMSMHRFMVDWQNYIINEGSFTLGYYNDVVGGAVICPLNEENIPTACIGIKELYPLSIESLNLAFSDTDQYLQLSVQFAFRSWVNLFNAQAIANLIGGCVPGDGGLDLPGLTGIGVSLSMFDITKLVQETVGSFLSEGDRNTQITRNASKTRNVKVVENPNPSRTSRNRSLNIPDNS